MLTTRAISKQAGIWATPPELVLLLLFEYGVHLTLQDDGLPFAVLVSHVCTYWRAVAARSPSLWASIPVHPQRHGLTELFLARSANQVALALCFHLRSTRGAEDALALCLRPPHGDRVRTLCLCAHTNPAVFLFISRLRRMRLPRLVRFEVRRAPSGGGALGQLPPVLEDAPPATLAAVALRGACFAFHSPMLRNLTSLVLERLPPRMAEPSYATFRALLSGNRHLEHLKLDGVFPVLVNEIDYGDIELAALRTLDITIDHMASYVLDFFTILNVPAIHTLVFRSSEKTTWEGLETAFPIMEATFATLQKLLLYIEMDQPPHNGGVRPEMFSTFPELRELRLSAHDDAVILYYLQPWIEMSQQNGDSDDDDERFGTKFVWPKLEMLTIRAPFDTDDYSDDHWSIDDALELLGSLRMSMEQPFDVWQECISRI